MSTPKLTPARVLCLESLAYSADTNMKACKMAVQRGFLPKLNTEWADKHFRWLREHGLIEKTGHYVRRRAVHRLTEAGHRALDEYLRSRREDA